ncbi:MAG: TIGR02646 family protein [Sulfurovum sp.]
MYHFKCAYCEKDIKDEDKHIEHYRPKSRYYWLAYSWDNLLFSCGQCNRPKGRKFLTKKCSNLYGNESFDNIHNLGSQYDLEEYPMIINPEQDDVLSDIVFDNKAIISSHNERVQYTIDEACNLNRNGLVENRIKVFNALKRRIVKHIYNKDITGLESEIENFVEECSVESEYYAFRYFILNNIELFFQEKPLLRLTSRIIEKSLVSKNLEP